MASSLYDITVGGGTNSLLNTLRGYFVRYRLALYLSSAAAVALGVVLNWNWLTAAGLLRVMAVLPCALMMFRCIRHGTRRSDEETALPETTLSSRFSASSDPLLPRLDRGASMPAVTNLSNRSRLIAKRAK